MQTPAFGWVAAYSLQWSLTSRDKGWTGLNLQKLNADLLEYSEFVIGRRSPSTLQTFNLQIRMFNSKLARKWGTTSLKKLQNNKNFKRCQKLWMVTHKEIQRHDENLNKSNLLQIRPVPNRTTRKFSEQNPSSSISNQLQLIVNSKKLTKQLQLNYSLQESDGW